MNYFYLDPKLGFKYKREEEQSPAYLKNMQGFFNVR